MPRCRECGTNKTFLKLNKDGICCSCQIERQLLDNEDFNVTRIYSTYLPNNFIFFIALDERYKQFALCVQSVNKPYYNVHHFNYADIIDFAVNKHESSASKCSTLMLSLFVNSLNHPCVSFYLINSPTTIGSDTYNYAMQSMNDILGILHYIRFNA